MSNISYIITPKALTFFVEGKQYSVSKNVVSFAEIVAELAKPHPDAKRLIELTDVKIQIENKFNNAWNGVHVQDTNYLPKGVVTVEGDEVLFNGMALNNPLSQRLMEIVSYGLPVGPWIRFTENLYMNPAKHARDELLLWLEHSDLPITEDGCFLAYKKVRENYKDVHSGTFDNSVGQIVQLTGRDKVDPNRNNLCSRGLHFCSKSYLSSFGGQRVMVLKINPADVVSIPADYNNAKGRTWRYEVIDEIPANEVSERTWEPILNADSISEEEIVAAQAEGMQLAFHTGYQAGYDQGKVFRVIDITDEVD